MLERAITDKVLKWLNSLDGCVAEKVWGSAQQIGRPDINGCYKGRSFRIEMKSPDTGYKPSKLQLLNLEKWERCGAICAVCYSIEEVKNLFEKGFTFGSR